MWLLILLDFKQHFWWESGHTRVIPSRIPEGCFTNFGTTAVVRILRPTSAGHCHGASKGCTWGWAAVSFEDLIRNGKGSLETKFSVSHHCLTEVCEDSRLDMTIVFEIYLCPGFARFFSFHGLVWDLGLFSSSNILFYCASQAFWIWHVRSVSNQGCCKPEERPRSHTRCLDLTGGSCLPSAANSPNMSQPWILGFPLSSVERAKTEQDNLRIKLLYI